MREVLLFRLRFDVAAAATPRPAVPEDALPAERVREARPFRDELPRTPSASPEEPPDPEAVVAKREQANRGHHAIVRALNTLLHAVGCDAVAEIPGAIDLWARRQMDRA